MTASTESTLAGTSAGGAGVHVGTNERAAAALAGESAPHPGTGSARATRPPEAPDFFVVGHPKSGTTALYEMLRRHPQIYMPELKEPRFFADDMHVRADRPKPRRLPQSYEQYLALFEPAGADQRAGEASPFYLASRTAAAEIAAVRPDARIVAILREPASFLRSLHMQFVATRVEPTNDLRKALALERPRSEGRRVPASSHFPAAALMYSHYTRYVEQLHRYRAAFAPAQLLVLVYDDFRAENEATVRRVLRFLGVDERAPIAVHDANPTVRVRAQPLQELLHAVSVGRGPLARTAKRTIKACTPRSLRRDALATARSRVLWSEPRPPEEQLMRELRQRFKGEVVALSEYLDRDLVSLWGYDTVD
jgi:hypothetical protein